METSFGDSTGAANSFLLFGSLESCFERANKAPYFVDPTKCTSFNSLSEFLTSQRQPLKSPAVVLKSVVQQRLQPIADLNLIAYGLRLFVNDVKYCKLAPRDLLLLDTRVISLLVPILKVPEWSIALDIADALSCACYRDDHVRASCAAAGVPEAIIQCLDLCQDAALNYHCNFDTISSPENEEALASNPLSSASKRVPPKEQLTLAIPPSSASWPTAREMQPHDDILELSQTRYPMNSQRKIENAWFCSRLVATVLRLGAHICYVAEPASESAEDNKLIQSFLHRLKSPGVPPAVRHEASSMKLVGPLIKIITNIFKTVFFNKKYQAATNNGERSTLIKGDIILTANWYLVLPALRALANVVYNESGAAFAVADAASTLRAMIKYLERARVSVATPATVRTMLTECEIAAIDVVGNACYNEPKARNQLAEKYLLDNLWQIVQSDHSPRALATQASLALNAVLWSWDSFSTDRMPLSGSDSSSVAKSPGEMHQVISPLDYALNTVFADGSKLSQTVSKSATISLLLSACKMPGSLDGLLDITGNSQAWLDAMKFADETGEADGNSRTPPLLLATAASGFVGVDDSRSSWWHTVGRWYGCLRAVFVEALDGGTPAHALRLKVIILLVVRHISEWSSHAPVDVPFFMSLLFPFIYEKCFDSDVHRADPRCQDAVHGLFDREITRFSSQENVDHRRHEYAFDLEDAAANLVMVELHALLKNAPGFSKVRQSGKRISIDHTVELGTYAKRLVASRFPLVSLQLVEKVAKFEDDFTLMATAQHSLHHMVLDSSAQMAVGTNTIAAPSAATLSATDIVPLSALGANQSTVNSATTPSTDANVGLSRCGVINPPPLHAPPVCTSRLSTTASFHVVSADEANPDQFRTATVAHILCKDASYDTLIYPQCIHHGQRFHTNTHFGVITKDSVLSQYDTALITTSGDQLCSMRRPSVLVPDLLIWPEPDNPPSDCACRGYQDCQRGRFCRRQKIRTNTDPDRFFFRGQTYVVASERMDKTHDNFISNATITFEDNQMYAETGMTQPIQVCVIRDVNGAPITIPEGNSGGLLSVNGWPVSVAIAAGSSRVGLLRIFDVLEFIRTSHPELPSRYGGAAGSCWICKNTGTPDPLSS